MSGHLQHFGGDDLALAAAHLGELARTKGRGLIVAGPQLPAHSPDRAATTVMAFGERAGWPVLADIASPFRHDGRAIAHMELLTRSSGFVANMAAPEVVVRIGAPLVSKGLRLWLEASPPEHLVVFDPSQRWEEPTFAATATIAHHALPVLEAMGNIAGGPQAISPTWSQRWAEADQSASATVTDVVHPRADESFNQPALASAISTILKTLDDTPGTDAASRDAAGRAESIQLYLSNSMPVRDMDTFAASLAPQVGVQVNRGANGIDGMISSAAGAALGTGSPALLYTGDLAFLHDLGGLVTANQLSLNLTIVVADNDGGGIFSHLPIAARGDEIGFDRLFHTPHGLDLVEVASIGAVRPRRIDETIGFEAELRRALRSPGVDVLVVPIDHEMDMARRRELQATVSAAVGERLDSLG